MALLNVPPVTEESPAPDDRNVGESIHESRAKGHDELFGHCRRCAGVVFASAKHCSHCDFDVDDHNRQRLVYGGVGMLLTLTGVLAPLGLPLLWYGRHHREQAARGVTDADVAGLPTFLKRLLESHLSLALTPTERGEFTRSGGNTSRRVGFPPEL